MRKNLLSLILLGFLAPCLFGQGIGNTTISFNDPVRNRTIDAEIFYPAATSGSNVPVATGQYPVLIFGHGFVMGVGSYDNFSDHLVPQGYILALPTTEGGFSPDHGEFGKDLAFLVDAMQSENTNSGSILNGAILNKTALMGHSMGGGASFLGAASATNATALVNFAAAETNPSAVTAAASVSIPALLFAGSKDCVTPPPGNQEAMYNALTSSCKTYISINDGGHCYFANYNFNCTFGESTCLPVVPISREQQQDVVNDFISPWLDYTLKGNTAAFDDFNDSLNVSGRITFQQACIASGNENPRHNSFEIFPNPAKNRLQISFQKAGKYQIELWDGMGRNVRKLTATNSEIELDLGGVSPGIYLVTVLGNGFKSTQKLVIQP